MTIGAPGGGGILPKINQISAQHNRPHQKALGNKLHKLCRYPPEPRAEVYCSGLNLRMKQMKIDHDTLYMDQKVCLNLVKKDQLCAIALMNRKWILKVLLKIDAMESSHSLLKQWCQHFPLFYKTRFWLSNKHIVQVSVLFCDMNLSFGS